MRGRPWVDGRRIHQTLYELEEVVVGTENMGDLHITVTRKPHVYVVALLRRSIEKNTPILRLGKEMSLRSSKICTRPLLIECKLLRVDRRYTSNLDPRSTVPLRLILPRTTKPDSTIVVSVVLHHHHYTQLSGVRVCSSSHCNLYYNCNLCYNYLGEYINLHCRHY